MGLQRRKLFVDKLMSLTKDTGKFIKSLVNRYPKDYERLDQLVFMLESTHECKEAYQKLEECYSEIKSYLPVEKSSPVIMKLDDCVTGILVIYEEYFYRQGLKDGKRKK